MIIENKYQPEVDRVFGLLFGFQKGETIPWVQVESAMGMHRDDRGGRTIIRRVIRRLLSERQITAFPLASIGVRLMTDMQAATEVPVMRQRRARRQLGRGIRETAAVDCSQLTTHAATTLALSRQHMKSERLLISQAAREVDAIMRPSRSVLPAVR